MIFPRNENYFLIRVYFLGLKNFAIVFSLEFLFISLDIKIFFILTYYIHRKEKDGDIYVSYIKSRV